MKEMECKASALEGMQGIEIIEESILFMEYLIDNKRRTTNDLIELADGMCELKTALEMAVEEIEST